MSRLCGTIKVSGANYRPLAGLNNQCHALAHTYTHGAERIAATAAFEFIGGGQHQPRPRHAKRMTKRNRPTIWVYMRRVIGNAKPAKAGPAPDKMTRSSLFLFAMSTASSKPC